MKFKPPMTSSKGDFSYLKTNLFSHLISALLWEIKDAYNASKGFYQYLRIQHMVWYATIIKPLIVYSFLKLERFIITFKRANYGWLQWLL